MEQIKYRYYKGGKTERETIEYEAPDDFYGTTTCVVNVPRLIDGYINTFPCGSGADYRLSIQERVEILEAVKRGRSRYTEAQIKTLDGWKQSGIGTFGDYCRPGDLVDEEIVEHFVNSVPPHTLRGDCTQAGEPYSIEKDPKTGKYRNTWTTFHREEGSLWRFDGACFTGENVHRAGEMSKLENAINRLRGKKA